MRSRIRCVNVELHLHLPRIVAHRIRPTLPPGLDIEDLIQAGTIGLIRAAQDYKPARGCKFESYAWIRIEGAIRDSVRFDGLHKRVQPGRRRVRFHLESELVTESREGKKVTPFFDRTPDPGWIDPGRQATRWDAIDRACRGFSITERVSFILYQGYDFKFREIGDILGLSESRVCQVVGKVRERLGLRAEVAR